MGTNTKIGNSVTFIGKFQKMQSPFKHQEFLLKVQIPKVRWSHSVLLGNYWKVPKYVVSVKKVKTVLIFKSELP